MLFSLLHQEARGSWPRLLAATLLPGLGQAALIAFIQAGIYADGDESGILCVIFALLCVLQVVFLRRCALLRSKITEAAL